MGGNQNSYQFLVIVARFGPGMKIANQPPSPRNGRFLCANKLTRGDRPYRTAMPLAIIVLGMALLTPCEGRSENAADKTREDQSTIESKCVVISLCSDGLWHKEEYHDIRPSTCPPGMYKQACNPEVREGPYIMYHRAPTPEGPFEKVFCPGNYVNGKKNGVFTRELNLQVQP